MKRKISIIAGAAIALLLLVMSALAQSEFTLARAAKSSSKTLEHFALAAATETPSSREVEIKRLWLGALEAFSFNVAVWAVGRYILKKDFSRISWRTWKRNLSSQWVWCNDTLGTGFFGHPYHGSQLFNSARSLGMSFWESIPYAAGGYVMWGYFFENGPPSYNDLMWIST